MGAAVRTDYDNDESAVSDSGHTCVYDGDTIEYMDSVMCVKIMRPYISEGRLLLFDIPNEDDGDYLYEPAFVHGKNWDEIEEKFLCYGINRPNVQVSKSLLTCKFCNSGILEGESMGIAVHGEIHRSSRNPDLFSYGNHFEPLNSTPVYICITCMVELNNGILEIWDGVANGEECKQGTQVRCWRQGCAGNCPEKNND